MQAELQTFLESPTARNYRLVRETLLDEVGLPPVSELAEIAALSAAGRHAEVLDRVADLLPRWSLSPRIHFYAALSADHLGEAETAEIERFVFQSCLEGVLATGDGSPEAPFLITHTSDEYDVLTALGYEPRSQKMVDRNGLVCDVVECRNDEEVWFELTGLVTDARQRLAEAASVHALRQ